MLLQRSNVHAPGNRESTHVATDPLYGMNGHLSTQHTALWRTLVLGPGSARALKRSLVYCSTYGRHLIGGRDHQVIQNKYLRNKTLA